MVEVATVMVGDDGREMVAAAAVVAVRVVVVVAMASVSLLQDRSDALVTRRE